MLSGVNTLPVQSALPKWHCIIITERIFMNALLYLGLLYLSD